MEQRETEMKVMVSEADIAKRVAALGESITREYAGKDLTVVIIMNGALIFGADLVRQIKLPIRVDLFAASSYVNDQSSGNLKVRSELKNSPAGRHLLLVDDILDTGFSMKRILEHFAKSGALSIKTCVLLNKHVKGKQFITPDWVGFDIPDRYVVGYGLDSEEEYRNLPCIAVLE